MRKSFTATDVLNDIEFELMQGSVARDELGQGIQATRQYQNKMRAETLQLVSDQKMDSAELVGRQFQVNDMVLALFKAVDAKLQTLQAELRRAAYLKQHESHHSDEADGTVAQSAPLSVVEDGYPRHDEWLPEYVGVDETTKDDLVDAMADDALDIPLAIRPVRVPLIGWFLTRLRASLHTLTLFYVEQLADKQRPINRAVGERILHLEQVNRQQQLQIEALNAQVIELHERLDG